MSTFQTTIDQRFPGTRTEAEFLFYTYEALTRLGFTEENTLPCVGICRDELGFFLRRGIEAYWGEMFSLSGLAGMLFLGETGMKAAHEHAPIFEGRERFIYIVMPHIAVGEGGEPGLCMRPGRPGASTACGALAGFLSDLRSGFLDMSLQNNNLEQSLLKTRLLQEIPFGHLPDLIELTLAAHTAIVEDLEALIGKTVDLKHADYALLSGVHIHGPENAGFIWPGSLYAVVEGRRAPIVLP